MQYWQAFHTLSRSRGIAGGFTPIPQPLAYSEMAAYATDHFIANNPGELDEFVEILQAMDNEYLSFQASKASKKVANEGKSRPPRRS